MKNTLLHLEHTDAVTGLPTRRAFAAHFQRWLVSQADGVRFVAVNVRLPTVRSQSGSKGIDGTLQDLLAYRACTLLTQRTWQNTLLGRTDRQSLLMVQVCSHNKTASYRAFVRDLLGNLGGLIDDPERISVTTLVSATPTLSANNILQRLQARATTDSLDLEAVIGSAWEPAR